VSDAARCPSCGTEKGLGEDGRCKNKAACLKRATKDMVTTPYVGGFDPVEAYRDAQKGEAT
jgi:hypothetical protein